MHTAFIVIGVFGENLFKERKEWLHIFLTYALQCSTKVLLSVARGAMEIGVEQHISHFKQGIAQ